MNRWYWKFLTLGTLLCFLGMYLGTTCLSIGSTLLLGLGLPLLVAKRRDLAEHPLLKPFLLFLLALGLSAVFAESYPVLKTFFRLRYFLCLFVSGFVFARVPLLKKVISQIVLWVPFALTPIAILQRARLNSVINQLFGIPNIDHATGFLTHHSAFGLSLVYLLLIIYPQIRTQNSKTLKTFSFVSCFLCVVLVFLSFSRGAFVALAVSFCALFFAERLSGLRVALVSLFALACLAFIFLNSSLRDRFTNLDEARFSDRVELLSFSWDEFKRNPFLGHGFGRFKLELEKHPERQRRANNHGHPHNIYLSLASGAGSLGLVSFLWFVMVLTRALLRKIKTGLLFQENGSRERCWYLSLFGIWCAFLTGGLFDEFLLWNQIIIPTMTLLGSGFYTIGQSQSCPDSK